MAVLPHLIIMIITMLLCSACQSFDALHVIIAHSEIVIIHLLLLYDNNYNKYDDNSYIIRHLFHRRQSGKYYCYNGFSRAFMIRCSVIQGCAPNYSFTLPGLRVSNVDQ